MTHKSNFFLVRRFFLLALLWLSFGVSGLTAKPLDLSVHAESAILMNADTGVILYEKNGRTLQVPASITKIATAIYALTVRGDRLDKMIAAEHDSIASISDEELRRSNYTLPSYWLVPGAAHIGIKRGEELSLKDLLYGMMLPSGDDASNVIAQYIGGTIPTFMELLNEYLKSIGCHDTTFKNPHGLYHPDHRTTAYDMAILAAEALKNQTFCDIVGTVRYTRPQTNMQNPTTLLQTNQLLRRGKFYYSKAIGIKTGYLSVARSTLVAAARDKDRTLIAVLLKCDNRGDIFRDAIKMFETAFAEKKIRRKFLSAGPQQAGFALEGASRVVKTCLERDVALDFYSSEEPKVKCLLNWDKVSLPIEKGQRVGVLSFQDTNGLELHSEPLFAFENVGYSWFYRLKQFFGGGVFRLFSLGVLSLFFLISLLFLSRR